MYDVIGAMETDDNMMISNTSASDMTEDWEFVDEDVLGGDDFSEIRCHLSPVVGSWKALAAALGLPTSSVVEVDQEGRGDPLKCLDLALERWLNQDYPCDRFGLPSWRRLVMAVGSGSGGRHTRLAREIAERHPVLKHKQAHKGTVYEELVTVTLPAAHQCSDTLAGTSFIRLASDQHPHVPSMLEHRQKDAEAGASPVTVTAVMVPVAAEEDVHEHVPEVGSMVVAMPTAPHVLPAMEGMTAASEEGGVVVSSVVQVFDEDRVSDNMCKVPAMEGMTAASEEGGVVVSSVVQAYEEGGVSDNMHKVPAMEGMTAASEEGGVVVSSVVQVYDEDRVSDNMCKVPAMECMTMTSEEGGVVVSSIAQAYDEGGVSDAMHVVAQFEQSPPVSGHALLDDRPVAVVFTPQSQEPLGAAVDEPAVVLLAVSEAQVPVVQKLIAFAEEPMDDKPVTALDGVSNKLGECFIRKGFDKAYTVLGQFLLLKKNKELFVEWLKVCFDAEVQEQMDCYDCLDKWCKAFL